MVMERAAHRCSRPEIASFPLNHVVVLSGRVDVLDGLGAREIHRLLDRRRNRLAYTLLGFAESSERNA